MKKILNYFIWAIILMFSFHFLVLADDEIAICEYKSKTSEDTITLTFYYDTTDISSSAYNKINTNVTSTTIKKEIINPPRYHEFISKTKFSCEKTIYYTDVFDASKADQRIYTHAIYIAKTPKDSTSIDYELIQETIFIEEPDKETLKSGGWKNICHYDYKTLYIGMDDYKVEEPSLSGGYVREYKAEGNMEVLEFLQKNYYSCPVAVCHSTSGSTITYYFYNESPSELIKSTCVYSTSYTGNTFTCGGLQHYMNELEKQQKIYESDPSVLNLSTRNETVQRVENFCDTIFNSMDYGNPSKCVEECLDISSIINERIGTSESDDIVCGFSGRLLAWISNIFRWIKYILPVVVIILGILDFLKALGSDKDDEMKKAQGNFVKRLIAAALVFIVPLIIEFILEKMGFGYDSCGLF